MSVALITGASRGIGRAIAVHLARHGFEAYASMRDLGDGSPLVRLAEAEGLALHPITRCGRRSSTFSSALGK
jgi:NAD(P)-dependent dehydrogenase (short-subunit alcohol dehydrogenase family)